MFCPKHPSQKLVELFSSVVCDICDPPKSLIKEITVNSNTPTLFAGVSSITDLFTFMGFKDPWMVYCLNVNNLRSTRERWDLADGVISLKIGTGIYTVQKAHKNVGRNFMLEQHCYIRDATTNVYGYDPKKPPSFLSEIVLTQEICCFTTNSSLNNI